MYTMDTKAANYDWTFTELCVKRGSMAQSDYSAGQLRLREELSLKWKLCWLCRSTKVKHKWYTGKKLRSYECDKCFKPVKKMK